MSVRELEPFVNDGLFWIWQQVRPGTEVRASNDVALVARWVIDWREDRIFKVVVTESEWKTKHGKTLPTDALLNEFVSREPFEIEGVGMVRLLLPEDVT